MKYGKDANAQYKTGDNVKLDTAKNNRKGRKKEYHLGRIVRFVNDTINDKQIVVYHR